MNWDNVHDDYSFSQSDEEDSSYSASQAKNAKEETSMDMETHIIKVHLKSSLAKVHHAVANIPCSFLFFAPFSSFKKISYTRTHIMAIRAALTPFFSRFESLEPVLLIPYILWTYRRLLRSLYLLQEHNIFCASYDNIGFKNHTPYIRDFSYDQEQEDHCSLETEFSHFLRNQEKTYSVTRDDIVAVSRKFLVERGETELAPALDTCLKFFQKMLRWSREKAISWLESYREKAAIFSLGSLYVHLIEELSIYDVPEPFLQMLTKSISYLPDSRPTMEEAMCVLHALM